MNAFRCNAICFFAWLFIIIFVRFKRTLFIKFKFL